MSDGTMYVRPGNEARIVGPEQATTALAAALNDEQLQVAFVSTPDFTPALVTARMMSRVDVDHPVLVLPEAARALWDAEARVRDREIQEYTGPLPDMTATKPSTFGIVRPKYVETWLDEELHS